MSKSNIKEGWIEVVEKDCVYARLRKEGELDEEMVFDQHSLSEDKQKFIRKGQIFRFIRDEERIEFLDYDGETWIA